MPDKSPTFELLAALVCDDRRREDNGKELLIGIYTGAIVFSRLPSPFQCVVWLYVKIQKAGKLPIQFRIIAPSGKQLFFGRTESTLIELEDTISLPFPRIGMLVEEEGWHSFQWQLPGQDWSEIFKKRVLLQTTADQENAAINSSTS